MNIEDARKLVRGMWTHPVIMMDETEGNFALRESIAWQLITASDRAKEKQLELPNLGLATTRELLAEVSARIDIHCLAGLDYRTVDDVDD